MDCAEEREVLNTLVSQLEIGECESSRRAKLENEFLMFLANPIGYFDQLFGNHVQQLDKKWAKWEKIVLEKCCSFFSTDEDYKRIPLFNGMTSLDPANTPIIRFRCMVQDIRNPEYYLGVYNVQNTETGQVKEYSGLFRDSIYLEDSEILLETSVEEGNCKLMERRAFYCVSVPGEASWVKMADIPASEKNSLEEQDSKLQFKTMEIEIESEQSASVVQLDQKVINQENRNTLNLPLFGLEMEGSSKSCFVKVYDNNDCFPINDVVEIIGILSKAPIAEAECEYDDDEPRGIRLDVPHLHAVAIRKLVHINPYLPQTIHDYFDYDAYDAFIKCQENTMNEIRQLLSDCLFGDSIAAEYLLLNLISDIVHRVHGLPGTKFAVNLRSTLKCPSAQNPQFFPFLATFIESLLTKSVLFNLTIDFLNNAGKFIPSIDDARLQTGFLQLSNKTALLIDESRLTTGQLTEAGTRNIKALQTLVSSQKVVYQLPFSTLEFQADVPTLVYSVGPSIVKCDVDVCLVPTYKEERYEQAKLNVTNALQSTSTMEKMRNCLTQVCRDKYKLNEPMAEVVQKDFLESRKTPAGLNRLEAEDLHLLLVTARIYCIARGKDILDEKTWKAVRQLDLERKNRLKKCLRN